MHKESFKAVLNAWCTLDVGDSSVPCIYRSQTPFSKRRISSIKFLSSIIISIPFLRKPQICAALAHPKIQWVKCAFALRFPLIRYKSLIKASRKSSEKSADASAPSAARRILNLHPGSGLPFHCIWFENTFHAPVHTPITIILSSS